LKYAGGKRELAPKLAEMYEPFRSTHTWVEPFCGALGATLGVMPERAILSDTNKHLINLYRFIDNGMLNHQLRQNWQNTKENYYDIRKRFNTYQFSDEFHAQSFYWMNHTCFNGLCRFNLKGEFNVAYGNYKKPKLDHDFSKYQEAFVFWDFFNYSYDVALSLSKDQPHFVYADPPYADGFTGYSGSFTWDDQVNLASSLAALNSPVVANNKATDRIIDLYQGFGFDIEIISMKRRISCDGDRTDAQEILATRNLK
jgi:DNA adenine methylase